ncbi:hypothetical protein CORC01_07501 [Colletotrichum orchidophilum]|uniref:Lincomycin-condensing protein lmbA n=1 Tax=Colletotrichum orchidophilum TaxID=1209926 RepID=A0A1G4B760_9PEZI|nr:uncharacterized protein CORC01_07501 [Colletotrichum orchidophilum]OHE97247.1 hypothetical protein CORC01_07501 [Colletotrichum orchidophilum]
MERDTNNSCRLLDYCLPQLRQDSKPVMSEKKEGIIDSQPLRSSALDAASEFVDTLRTAEKGGKDLERRLRNIVTANSWSEELAKYILDGVEGLVRHRDTVGQVLKETMDKSTEAAESVFELAKAHPVFVTVIAIGVLVIVAPWVLEALGFGELGPVADTFASWWQARYAGYVPKGSLFSFLERLGMTWK